MPEQPTAVVANLPYNVAVPVLLHLLATFPSWQRGLVMVQAEVADRLAAGPGSKTYGVPSVKMAWYAAADPGRHRVADGVLAGAERRVGSGGDHGAHRPRRQPPASRSSPSSMRHSPSGARCCARRWPVWPARRPRPVRPSPQLAWIRRPAAKRWTSLDFARIAEQIFRQA